MRFKRVFLIFPGYKEYDMGALHPPLGIGYLAQALKQHDIEYEILDMRLGYRKLKLIKKIQHFKPDLIGLSLMTLQYKRHYELIQFLNKHFPNTPIVSGGPHISTFREKALEECPEIDFGVVMEGEEALIELCLGKDISKIKNLLYRENNQIAYNGSREFLNDLDAVRFPRYEKFELDKYISDEIAILTSRGCPYRCIYCPVSTVIGEKFRARNPACILDEIEYWYRKGYRKIGIADDNFTLIKNRVHEICDEIEKRGLEGIEFKCGNGIRADMMDRELLIKMRKVGFKYLAFGVEAGNDKVLKVIKKGENIDVIKRVIKDACDLGYEVTLFFLVGSPGETEEDIRDSIKIAQENPIFDARFYNIIPFPKTELFDWIGKNSYFIKKPEVYLNNASHFDNTPVFYTPELNLAERKRILRYLRVVRKKIRYQAISNRLKRLGVLRNIIALIYITDFMQDYILKHRFYRKSLRSLYEKIGKSN